MKKIVSFVCVVVFSLFLTVSDSLADEVGGNLNNNLSKESSSSYVKKNNEKTEIHNSSNEDIFGDEQAFHFIAGLGKNAAH